MSSRRTPTTARTWPMVPTRRLTRMLLVEKGGPKSMYWTLSRRYHHQDPRSRGQSRSSPPHPSHGGEHPRRQRGAHAHSGGPREELHRRQGLRLERCRRRDPTATHEGRDPAEVESERQAQVQPQALPDSALRREPLLQDKAVQACGHPLREDLHELPWLRSLRCAASMAGLSLCGNSGCPEHVFAHARQSNHGRWGIILQRALPSRTTIED